MKDCFALLGLPRQPWFDSAKLKAAFLTLSNEAHPDRFHNAPSAVQQAASARFAELNDAHRRLSEPKDRLLHLLELELGRRPEEIQSVPADATELFMQLAKLCRDVDAFLGEKAKITSPIVQAQVFGRALEWTDRLQVIQSALGCRRELLEERLKVLNTAWAGHGQANETLAELEQIYRQLSFLGRWAGQIQERLVRLSL